MYNSNNVHTVLLYKKHCCATCLNFYSPIYLVREKYKKNIRTLLQIKFMTN